MAARRTSAGRQVHPDQLKLVLSVEEAAEAMSVSRDSFERHVMPQIRLVHLGRRLLIPVVELERWVESHSAEPLLAELARMSAVGRG